jgi:hypothetical protein
MKTRLTGILLVIAMLLALVPGVSAQGDDDFLTCFNLSEADCAILLEAMANSENISSFSMDYAIDFSLANLGAVAMMMGGAEGEMPGDITMNVAGDGTFAENMEVMPPFAMQTELTASLNDGMEPIEGSMGVVIVDGVIYFRDPESDMWLGITFEDAMASADMESGGMFSDLLGGDPAALPEGSLSADDLLGGETAAMLEEFGMTQDQIMGLFEIEGFINMERLADADMMGQTMHVFQQTVDTAPLFNSPEFSQILDGVISAAAAEDPEAAQMAMIVPMLLGSTAITVTQQTWVGADDMFIHGLVMDLNAELDLGMLMGAAGGESEMQIPPITMDIHFEVTVDEIGGTFEFVAPEGAEMIDPSAM